MLRAYSTRDAQERQRRRDAAALRVEPLFVAVRLAIGAALLNERDGLRQIGVVQLVDGSLGQAGRAALDDEPHHRRLASVRISTPKSGLTIARQTVVSTLKSG